MRNFICGLFTFFMWKREVIVCQSTDDNENKVYAKIVFYRRPWEKNPKRRILDKLAKADFFEEVHSFW